MEHYSLKIRSRILRLFVAGAMLAGINCAAASAATLTYADLVKRLTDMEQIAELPPAGEKVALASSYDRASKYDAVHDKYIDWGANRDGSGIVRQEGDDSVLAEIKGPGCIWRTWTATTGTGHVMIFLDGATIPVVDVGFEDYFNHRLEPFTRPNLVYKTAAEGFDNFTPIPFQKSCKIVAEKGWGKYYHFNYTQFPPGTVVPTFKLPLPKEALAALDEANRIMGQCGHNPAGPRPGEKTETKSITVGTGEKGIVADLDGPLAITALKAKLSLPNDLEQQRMLLAQLTVSITWDGDAQPAVWSPLGDFFATGAGAVPFETLPVGFVSGDTFYCYWYMPFAKKAHIEVGNDSPKSVTMTWEVSHAPLTKPIELYGRFHAKWHRDAFLPTRADRSPDWTLLTTTGQGRYVGTQLHISNPRGGWWGEGDEKFFVDGEKFPSIFGTGSEDYFGYAWGDSKMFVQALHSQPVNENNAGQIDVNRWHIPDGVPFQKSFEGCIEKYDPNLRDTYYAAVAYWYLSATGTDPYGAAPLSERAGWWARPDIYYEPGAIEGESLRRLDHNGNGIGHTETWSLGKRIWSGDDFLVWSAKTVGETADFELPAQAPGKYRLVARFSDGPDGGTFQVSVNDNTVGQPTDLYAPKTSAANPVELGTVDLKATKPVMRITVTGKSAASSGLTFGLDYIKLIRVQ